MRFSTRIAFISMFVVCAGMFWQSQALAEVPKDLLVGTWNGQMIMVAAGEKESVPLVMTFQADGKASMKSGDSKPDETTYQIEGDSVLLKDPEGKGNDVKMTKVVLDKTSLKADLEAVGAGPMPEGSSIKVELTR